MKPYKKYKDSGIMWIGDIPEHWETKKLKYLTENLDAIRVPLSSEQRGIKQGEYPYYGATGIIDFIDEYLFNGNYVLIGEDGAPFFIENRNVSFKATGKFWVNNHAHILKCKEGQIEDIIVHQLNCVDYRQYITGSTRDKLTQSSLNDINLINIPLPEQITIANYLDSKTAEIDQNIADKEQLISLFEEEKKALINEAVTKGLNPKVKLKPSGIDWLGEIPEHWEVKKLKYLLQNTKGALKPGPFGSDLKTTDYLMEGNYKVYTQRNVLDNDFVKGDDYISDEKFDALNVFEIGANDILVTTRGSIGKAAVFPENMQKGIIHPCLIKLQIDNKKVLNEWLIMYFNESSYFEENVHLESNSTIIDVIYGYTLNNIIIPTPPTINEQKEVLKVLNIEFSKINDKINLTKQEIELLKEYRQALIFEAVTGKIDITIN